MPFIGTGQLFLIVDGRGSGLADGVVRPDLVCLGDFILTYPRASSVPPDIAVENSFRCPSSDVRSGGMSPEWLAFGSLASGVVLLQA